MKRASERLCLIILGVLFGLFLNNKNFPNTSASSNHQPSVEKEKKAQQPSAPSFRGRPINSEMNSDEKGLSEIIVDQQEMSALATDNSHRLLSHIKRDTLRLIENAENKIDSATQIAVQKAFEDLGNYFSKLSEEDLLTEYARYFDPAAEAKVGFFGEEGVHPVLRDSLPDSLLADIKTSTAAAHSAVIAHLVSADVCAQVPFMPNQDLIFDAIRTALSSGMKGAQNETDLYEKVYESLETIIDAKSMELLRMKWKIAGRLKNTPDEVLK